MMDVIQFAPAHLSRQIESSLIFIELSFHSLFADASLSRWLVVTGNVHDDPTHSASGIDFPHSWFDIK